MPAESISSHPPQEPSALRLGLFAFVLTFITALISLAFSKHLSHLDPIWWSNGILLAAVMAARRQAWPMLLAAGGTAIVLAHITVLHNFSGPVILLALCNLLEVLIAAWALRVWLGDSFDLTSTEQLWRFVLTAVLIAPFISGIFASLLHYYWQGTPFARAMFQWYFASNSAAGWR